MILQLRRWLPGRPLVLVGDSGYAVLDLLHFCQSLREPVTLITRLRLDAGLYAPAPPRRPGQNGRPRVKGVRLPTLKELLDQSALSWITLAAHSLQKRGPITQRKAAWYNNPAPTFVDAIAMVRRHLWIASEGFSTSPPRPDDEKAPDPLYARLLDSLAYAA